MQVTSNFTYGDRALAIANNSDEVLVNPQGDVVAYIDLWADHEDVDKRVWSIMTTKGKQTLRRGCGRYITLGLFLEI